MSAAFATTKLKNVKHCHQARSTYIIDLSIFKCSNIWRNYRNVYFCALEFPIQQADCTDRYQISYLNNLNPSSVSWSCQTSCLEVGISSIDPSKAPPPQPTPLLPLQCKCPTHQKHFTCCTTQPEFVISWDRSQQALLPHLHFKCNDQQFEYVLSR